MKQLFTSDEIESVLSLWQSKTVQEIATELNRSIQSIQYIANRIRKISKNGIKLLPKKHIKGTLDTLIKTTLAKLNLE